MIEAELFENRRFEGDDSSRVMVLRDSKGDVLIREEDVEHIIWINNKTALKLATWILDNVSEMER